MGLLDADDADSTRLSQQLSSARAATVGRPIS